MTSNASAVTIRQNVEITTKTNSSRNSKQTKPSQEVIVGPGDEEKFQRTFPEKVSELLSE